MTGQPKRIPTWLKVDATIAFLTLLVVAAGIWIASARLPEMHP